jgi:aryl-alcohol dehydrogenase-like predicted oxidoreductase
MPGQLDHYRLLGRSGLRVSPLALGTMTFGLGMGWGSDDDEAARMLDLYIDRGGNFLDTANFYGKGGSESLIGKLLEGRREPMVIATKYSLAMRPGDANAAGNHRRNMVRAVEDSLRRLRTDYIDLLYLHVWDFHTPVEEILRGFDDLVRAGKILYAGISDTPAWQVSRMQAIAELRGWAPLIALQIPYSLAERTVERDLIPMAATMGLGVLPWSPLAGGALSGKYSRADLTAPIAGNPNDSRKGINIASGRLSERTIDIAEVVVTVAGELGCTPSQVALAWTLLNPAVTAPLIGARTAAQLEDNLAALDVAFDDDQVARLAAVSAIEPGFPHGFLQGPAYEYMLGNFTVERR